MTWTQRADRIAYDEALMAQAPRATIRVSATLGPARLVPQRGHLAAIEVTSGAELPTKAVRLQRWFQGKGGFRYLNTERGNGADDLMAFLGEGRGAHVRATANSSPPRWPRWLAAWASPHAWAWGSCDPPRPATTNSSTPLDLRLAGLLHHRLPVGCGVRAHSTPAARTLPSWSQHEGSRRGRNHRRPQPTSPPSASRQSAGPAHGGSGDA